MRAISGRFLILAALLESLYIVLLTLGDLRQFIVEAILVQLLSGLFYLVCVYFLLQNRGTEKPHRSKSLPHFVLLAAAAFRLSVWPLYPAFSDDVHRYRWEGKLQVHGGNPYQVRPNDPEWAHLRDSTFVSVPLRDFKGGYGPLTELIERWTYRAVAASTADPVRQTFWFKLPGALFDLGILGALWVLAGVKRIPRERVLIYAWCPLPIMEFWATGHNDSIAVFFVVLAMLWASRERWMKAFSMLALGVAAKLWPVLLFPAFIGWRGWRPLRWYQWLVAIPIVGLTGLPYWSRVTENVQFMSGFVGGWRNNDSLYGALLWLTGDVYDAKYLGIGLICGVSLAGMWLRLPVERAWLAVTGATLLISANSHPWYLTWLLPALVFVPFKPFLLWIVLAPLAHHVVIDWAVLGEWRGSTPMRWLIYVPVYGWLAFSAISGLLRAGITADKPRIGRRAA